jgi:hypothetical protein
MGSCHVESRRRKRRLDDEMATVSSTKIGKRAPPGLPSGGGGGRARAPVSPKEAAKRWPVQCVQAAEIIEDLRAPVPSREAND